jgi:hypothetical protein
MRHSRLGRSPAILKRSLKHLDDVSSQAKIKVLTKAGFQDFCREISVAGGDHPRVGACRVSSRLQPANR